MNINRKTTGVGLSLGLWLVLVMLGVGCASTDQQGGGYEDNYGNNYGNSEGGDGEGANNASGNEYGGDEYGGDEYGGEYGEGNNYAADGGEGVNNAGYNEFENGQQMNLQQGGNNELALGDEEGYGEYTNNAEEPTDDLLSNTNAGLNLTGNGTNTAIDADAAPVNAAVDTPMMDAPVNVATPMPASGGIVKYIRETTNLLNSPNGQAVGSAAVGEHPVVWDEGNFHRDSRGRYIPSSALSVTGVGRPREGGSWRSSGGGGY